MLFRDDDGFRVQFFSGTERGQCFVCSATVEFGDKVAQGVSGRATDLVAHVDCFHQFSAYSRHQHHLAHELCNFLAETTDQFLADRAGTEDELVSENTMEGVEMFVNLWRHLLAAKDLIDNEDAAAARANGRKCSKAVADYTLRHSGELPVSHQVAVTRQPPPSTHREQKKAPSGRDVAEAMSTLFAGLPNGGQGAGEA